VNGEPAIYEVYPSLTGTEVLDFIVSSEYENEQEKRGKTYEQAKVRYLLTKKYQSTKS
jgi:hypothetical protein